MNRYLISLAWRSAWHRRFALSFTVISIALATLMLLSMERVRQDLRSHFVSAVSSTDLVVGARGGSLPLLLYTLFHVGSPTNTLKWSSVQKIANQPGVAWMVPIAKGDSHRGYPVIATTNNYFKYVRVGNQRSLNFETGSYWEPNGFEVVLGAEVAQQLNYSIDTSLTLAHGDGKLNTTSHDDMPFKVSGILERTGTPVDRTVMISLEAMEALHAGWLGGAPLPGQSSSLPARPPASAEPLIEQPSTPSNVNAALIGLERRAAVFSLQRYVNRFPEEPLMAILPGVALDELWGLINPVERSLRIMAWLIAAVSLAGLMSVILTSLNERRRELAILRSVGARPRDILALVSFESLFITTTGLLLGISLTFLIILFAGPWLQANYGLILSLSTPTPSEGGIILGIAMASVAASLIPAWRAYLATLSDGLSPAT